MYSRFTSRLKLTVEWLIGLLQRWLVYVTPPKYLAYDPSTRVVSCKGCLPAYLNGKKVNQYKLIIDTTFTPAPPLPRLLPMDARAVKGTYCNGGTSYLAINQVSPDAFRAEVNHCALSRGTALFTLLIIYQEVGEADNPMQPGWFYHFSEAVNCRGRRAFWSQDGWEENQEFSESGMPVKKTA
jgi:hypothetical protein